jgi:hypothetical protein
MLFVFLSGALLGLPPGGGTAAPPATTPGESLTSLYLYNFLLFVDWPREAFQDRSTLAIGVLDQEKGDRLFAGIEGKKVRGKTLAIQRLRRAEGIGDDLQVLFIRNATTPAILEVLDRLKGRPCLTVSRIAGFAELGGMVAFLPPPPAVDFPAGSAPPAARFRINLDAVLDAGLKIRSRLLRLSEITGDTPNGTPIGN